MTTPRTMAGIVSRTRTATSTVAARRNSGRDVRRTRRSLRGSALCQRAWMTIAASVASREFLEEWDEEQQRKNDEDCHADARQLTLGVG